MSSKATAPTQKGIKATTEAINNILEGSAQLQMCLNLYSTAAADNSIPIDQQAWHEAADLMKALNRLMYGEKARMDHMASNLRVETAVKRTVRRNFFFQKLQQRGFTACGLTDNKAELALVNGK